MQIGLRESPFRSMHYDSLFNYVLLFLFNPLLAWITGGLVIRQREVPRGCLCIGQLLVALNDFRWLAIFVGNSRKRAPGPYRDQVLIFPACVEFVYSGVQLVNAARCIGWCNRRYVRPERMFF